MHIKIKGKNVNKKTMWKRCLKSQYGKKEQKQIVFKRKDFYVILKQYCTGTVHFDGSWDWTEQSFLVVSAQIHEKHTTEISFMEEINVVALFYGSTWHITLYR